MSENNHPVVDWDDMTEEDRANALELLNKLNALMDKYTERDDEPCEDSTLTE